MWLVLHCRNTRDARACLWREGHGLGRLLWQAEEERPVARGGVLSSLLNTDQTAAF